MVRSVCGDVDIALHLMLRKRQGYFASSFVQTTCCDRSRACDLSSRSSYARAISGVRRFVGGMTPWDATTSPARRHEHPARRQVWVDPPCVSMRVRSTRAWSRRSSQKPLRRHVKHDRQEGQVGVPPQEAILEDQSSCFAQGLDVADGDRCSVAPVLREQVQVTGCAGSSAVVH